MFFQDGFPVFLIKQTKKFRGLMYKKVINTRMVFNRPIRTKSLNGLKCETLVSLGA